MTRTAPLRIALLGPANTVHLQRWAVALARRGHLVNVISQHRCDPALLPGASRICWLPYEGHKGYFVNARRLRHELATWRPDVLNAHYASGYGTTAALTAYPATLLSVWGSDVYDFPYEAGIKGWLIRKNLRSAVAVASTSNAMAQQVLRLTPERSEIDITPFGVDISHFYRRDEPRWRGAFAFGIVKTLAPKYGVDLLLHAFAGLLSDRQVQAEIPECRLLIVGDGPQRLELEKLASDLSIATCVDFVGSCAHAEVPVWLSRIDVFCAPSRLDSESFGVAVIEASACGLPVVVSDVGGLPEVVVDGQTGLVVPRNDVPALQAALKSLALDKALREDLGNRGRAHVSAHYEWAHCVERMEKSYGRTIALAKNQSSNPKAASVLKAILQQDGQSSRGAHEKSE